MLDNFPGDDVPMSRLLYIEENIPVREFSEDGKQTVAPEDCLQIAGVQHGEHFFRYSHVIRICVTPAEEAYRTPDNLPHMGTDKLVFYNYDVHGKFYWQASYSTALFLEGDKHQVLTL